MIILLAILFAVFVALSVAATVSHRRRVIARASLVWFAGLVPLILAIGAISRFEGSSFGSYLGLIPVIVTVLCIIDAKRGLSSRLARIGPKQGPRLGLRDQRASE